MSRGTAHHPEPSPVEAETARQPAPVKSASPHPWEMIIHPFKTVRFVNALRKDRRISWLRKLLYVGPIVLLVCALLLPESILAAVVALALPVIGPLADLPVDGVVDWAFIGLAAYALLGILPRAIVSEQHARIFHPNRIAQQRTRRER
jgi:hypothetical protein